jgi:3-deoxy-manno-octulosonate cytidylyltransferase (CMP-KDO synthetase)
MGFFFGLVPKNWFFQSQLQRAPDAVFSTAVTSLKPEDAFDTNRVKCVIDNQGYAIYFSRGLIPFNK